MVIHLLMITLSQQYRLLTINLMLRVWIFQKLALRSAISLIWPQNINAPEITSTQTTRQRLSMSKAIKMRLRLWGLEMRGWWSGLIFKYKSIYLVCSGLVLPIKLNQYLQSVPCTVPQYSLGMGPYSRSCKIGHTIHHPHTGLIQDRVESGMFLWYSHDGSFLGQQSLAK